MIYGAMNTRDGTNQLLEISYNISNRCSIHGHLLCLRISDSRHHQLISRVRVMEAIQEGTLFNREVGRMSVKAAQHPAGLLAQVMEGMQEGTLFNREVVEAEDAASRATSTAGSEDGGDAADTARDCATAARNASRKLQSLPTEVCACAHLPAHSAHVPA